MNTSPRYIVTTRLGTQVWDSTRPLLLGHPFRWVIEKTAQGIRIRELSKELNRIRKNSVQEVLDRDLKKGHSLRLDRDSVKIRPVLSLAQPRVLGPEALSGLDLT